MSLKDAAAREAVLKTLLDVVDAEYKQARAEVQALLDTAAEETGTTQIAASLPNGTKVATVSLTGGTAEAKVTDEQAFTTWVRKNYDTEIEREFITRVRKAFADRVLKECTAAGVAQWADPETGELHDVPGVEIRAARARTHSVRFAKDGRDQVAKAWQAGQLNGVVLPQLTAGDQS